MILVAVLLAAAISALSNGFALLVRQRDSLIGMVTFISLPLAFLSTIFMERSLLPSWMQDVSRLNSVNSAAVAARSATEPAVDWSVVAARAGLAALAAVCLGLATLAFRSYARTIRNSLIRERLGPSIVARQADPRGDDGLSARDPRAPATRGPDGSRHRSRGPVARPAAGKRRLGAVRRVGDAVDVSGTTAIVGAYHNHEHESPDEVGAAYVYVRSGRA